MSQHSSKLPINLEDLLRQRHVEGERIEYKAGWNPDPIIRTLCAFANDFQNLGGGYIVIGQDCDEDGAPVFPPVGIDPKSIDKIQQDLQTYCNLIQPPYFPRLSVETHQGQTLLVLWAPGGPHRPYKAPRAVTAKKKDYRYFIRRYASTVEAKDEDERELISLTARVPFDDRLHPSAPVSELSRPLMKQFLAEVQSELAIELEGPNPISTEALGRQMNVVGGSSEDLRPKNVGLLFFHEEPHLFFPVTQIDVVYFPEGAGGDKFEEKIFKGPLDRIIRDTLSFIKRSYLKQTVIKYDDRPEADRVWNFPFPAIEEAVVNAIYHRSYEIREPVEVRISPEDLVVLSFPGPERSIRIEQLKQGRAVSRRYRNRRIGEFLKELELTEGRSTGIKKILRVMKANGSPAPEFETDEDHSYFITRLLVHPQTIIGGDSKEPTAQDTAQVADHEGSTTPQATPQATPQVTPQVARLVSVLQGEADRETLQSLLGLSDRKYFRKAYLSQAIKEGLVEMTIPEHPNSMNQKYRLTQAGKRWVKEQQNEG